MRIFLIGYPGLMGGANTEAWHTIRLWRSAGIDVDLIPTWGADENFREKLDALGCTTHHGTTTKTLPDVANLPGSICVGFCNSEFVKIAPKLREIGCKLVWVNCMTFLFDHEKKFVQDHGPFDAMVYQSNFQRSQLEPQLKQHGYDPATGHLIRGAFDCDEWEFKPRAHSSGEEFWVGRCARPDLDKWSSNTFKIYEQINHNNKRGILLGVNDATRNKLGTPPWWIDCVAPMGIPVRDFYARLHCLLPVNGGARENWPRAGLEAMAVGVPVVAEDRWGWREMIDHGETGFLGGSDEELAHWAAVLAHDEGVRMRIARAAREKLVEELANPSRLWECWEKVFTSLDGKGPEHAGKFHKQFEDGWDT